MDNNNDTFMPQTSPNRLLPRILLAVVALGVLMLVGLGVRYALQVRTFHIVSTSPKLSRIATFTPYIEVNFSRNLSNNVTISSNPQVTRSHTVKGKTLRIYLISPDTTLQSKKYTITIKNIKSTSNELLATQTLTFTPNPNIDSHSQPKEIQDYLMQRQSKKPNSPDSIALGGLDELIHQGLTEDQFTNLQQALFKFAGQTPASVDTKSVQSSQEPQPDGTVKQYLNFNLKVGNKAYFAKLDYTDFSAVELFLYNKKTDAKPLFDSGMIDVVNGPQGD
jgi:hypothetical protein